ncbi:MAG: glycoside hydrolase family 3 C-terminal domain-containing protein [Balneola sp.]|nr:glycoside hydrolase family 3 C-terminal domain-containing protein [Balneola sp.]MBO6711897.1 glycoside hydrolase family 3 C-terminal domain-containing protein [Balneola sp.]MBO6800092.1 glycoside hydrolase family 3 C-terminal domain-containing protein [Balneola sp.]MBO6871527.1 glycoside hydrolase family 3 C-terminal domain-containing protein [Balneola sp.]
MSLALFSISSAQQKALYKNSEAPIKDRVEDLLSRMTVEEKIGQMTQLDITMINTTGVQKDVELDAKKAAELVRNHHIGSFLNGESVDHVTWYNFIYELQKIAIEESRLGIPIIYGIDHMHGASYLETGTIFPHNLNLAATFDPIHSYNSADVTVKESADLGHHWIFAPVLDLGRNPKWARFYETYGESPYLAAKLGSEYVRGIQEPKEGQKIKIAATGKHFLGYSDPKSGWDRTPVDISDQTLYEFHLPAFKAALDQGIKSLMVNSSEINGIPVHADKKILTTLLRDELGFEGVVVTDWDDIGKLVTYHYTADNFTEATFQAVDAGIDMSMTPLSLRFNESLLQLVDEGRITEQRLNESVRRILNLKFELGLFDNPYPNNKRYDRIGSNDSRNKALKAAEESLVLLKNQDAILPLTQDTYKNILLVGPSANSKRNLSGGWTIAWQGGEEARFPEYVNTLYTSLKATFPESNIVLAENWKDSDKLKKLSKNADLIISAIGEEPYTEFVGNITDLRLPEDQISLLKTLGSAETPHVSIFIGGRPRIIEDALSSMDAFLWAGLPGFHGADAITNVISGKVNPSGKLPFSYPKYSSHFTPYNHKPSDVYFFNPEEANNIEQGEKMVWQWPFGYGLSYTNFEYSDLKLSNTEITFNADLVATITVTNTGNVDGKESVLWFIRDRVGSITRPVKQLKNMNPILLKAGESKEISFRIQPIEHLSYPNKTGKLLLEEGSFLLMVGDQQVEFKISEPQVSKR